jgi:hypothetical protein
MRKGGWFVVLLSLVLALASGCQRLNFSKTYTLSPLVVQEITFDPPAYAQKVSVTITPTSAGVSAYLIKAADMQAVDRALQADKEPAASMLLASRVSKAAAETYTFEATIPAKTEYSLLLKGGTKSTDVKVSVVGR